MFSSKGLEWYVDVKMDCCKSHGGGHEKQDKSGWWILGIMVAVLLAIIMIKLF